jgi:hypothetical protein
VTRETRPVRRAARWLLAVAAFGGLILASVARPSAALANPPGRLYPAAGVQWTEPLDGTVRDLYSGGVGVSAAVGMEWPLRGRVELRGAWFRRSAHPDAPLAVRSDSRLSLIPITLEAQARLHRPGTSPFVLLGPAVLFAREEFTAQLLDESQQVSGDRTQWGGVFGLGIEAPTSRLNVRLAVRAMVVAGHRQVLRANGRHDDRDASAPGSLLTAGVELQLQ